MFNVEVILFINCHFRRRKTFFEGSTRRTVQFGFFLEMHSILVSASSSSSSAAAVAAVSTPSTPKDKKKAQKDKQSIKKPNGEENDSMHIESIDGAAEDESQKLVCLKELNELLRLLVAHSVYREAEDNA